MQRDQDKKQFAAQQRVLNRREKQVEKREKQLKKKEEQIKKGLESKQKIKHTKKGFVASATSSKSTSMCSDTDDGEEIQRHPASRHNDENSN